MFIFISCMVWIFFKFAIVKSFNSLLKILRAKSKLSQTVNRYTAGGRPSPIVVNSWSRPDCPVVYWSHSLCCTKDKTKWQGITLDRFSFYSALTWSRTWSFCWYKIQRVDWTRRLSRKTRIAVTVWWVWFSPDSVISDTDSVSSQTQTVLIKLVSKLIV